MFVGVGMGMKGDGWGDVNVCNCIAVATVLCLFSVYCTSNQKIVLKQPLAEKLKAVLMLYCIYYVTCYGTAGAK